MALVLKTGMGKLIVGSNPTPSAPPDHGRGPGDLHNADHRGLWRLRYAGALAKVWPSGVRLPFEVSSLLGSHGYQA